jgi:hypothetical protein
MTVLVVSTYPRADVFHLAFVAVLPYVLTATWMSWHTPRLSAVGLMIVPGIVAMEVVMLLPSQLRNDVPLTTPIGTIRGSPAELGGMRKLLDYVRPGDTLYVHPYGPILYVLTQAHNPTRYSYMWPGLMTTDDAESALSDLKEKPPKAVMYLEVDRDEYLRVFPNAYNLNHRFPDIEDWIAREYVPVKPPVWVNAYRLYRRRQ